MASKKKRKKKKPAAPPAIHLETSPSEPVDEPSPKPAIAPDRASSPQPESVKNQSSDYIPLILVVLTVVLYFLFIALQTP